MTTLTIKADIREAELRLESRIETTIAAAKVEIIKWMFGAFVAQTGLIIAAFRILR